MSGSLSLNGSWDLTFTEGGGAWRMNPDYYVEPTLRGKGLLKARVPAPVHQVLREAGLLEDPTYGLNSLRARWVEEMYWIYRRMFIVPAEATEQRAWLTFQCLELDATIYLNRERIGHHANANRPARFEITGKLCAGENILALKLESGIHAMADKPAGEYAPPDRVVLTKRQFLRNPQYQHGWDWHPRLVNVGILGDVDMEWQHGPRLDQVSVWAVPSADLSCATITVRATIDGAGEPMPATLRARINETGQEVALPLDVHPGEQRPQIQLELAHPRLWWPAGHGEQYRYTVEVSLEAGGQVQSVMRKTGVRLVELDQSAHPVAGRFFILTINNRPIFCKGANWGPADLFYSTVEDARYERLIKLAIEAHFNFLRINGVGLFVTPALAEACDAAGILLWHDFLFACAKYPGDEPDFAAEVRREVTWAVREFAHHPSLVLWCGNNEIEWGEWGEAFDHHYRTHPHYALFHRDIPRIVKHEDPSKLYWPSSPFSPDYLHPNDPTVGNQHPWGVSIFDAQPADWWRYREYGDRFANEGGFLGASPLATLREFLPDSERYLLSPSWEHHDNSFGMVASETGAMGRVYSAVEFWTGRDPLAMQWEEYAFVSALLQAEALAEFAANYRRRMFSSAAAAFWSYNDSWPVTHGWSIIDYRLRKKLAYFTIRRAFQPIMVVVAEDAGRVTIHGINDTPTDWAGELRFGLFTLEGRWPLAQRQAVTLAANASTPLAHFTRDEWEAAGLQRSGAGAVLLQNGQRIAQHRLFLARFKDLAFIEPQITLRRRGGELTLESDGFAWGVCLDVEGDVPVPDNCFDLLPGIPYALPWSEHLGEPKVVRFGNRDAVKPKVVSRSPRDTALAGLS